MVCILLQCTYNKTSKLLETITGDNDRTKHKTPENIEGYRNFYLQNTLILQNLNGV